MLISKTDKMIAEKDGPIGWITFNNPERRNAVSLAMWEALADIVRDFESDKAIRVIVLKGAGDRAFVSGADISEFEEKRSSPETTRTYNEASGKATVALKHVGKPTIAMIRGFCIGGGVSVALSCDMRIASEGATFGVPAAKLGLGYGFLRIERFSRIVGLPRAMGILLTGRRVPAKEGYELGFVTAVAPAGGAMEEARKWAAQMLECSPLALRATKEVARKTMLGEDFERKLVDAREFPAAKRLRTSNDYVEGPRAFAEKRKPNWTNT